MDFPLKNLREGMLPFSGFVRAGFGKGGPRSVVAPAAWVRSCHWVVASGIDIPGVPVKGRRSQVNGYTDYFNIQVIRVQQTRGLGSR